MGTEADSPCLGLTRGGRRTRSEPWRPSRRASVALIALAAAALPGLLPGTAGALDPTTMLAWIALIAAPAGVLAAASRLPYLPWSTVPPASWLFVWIALLTRDPQGLGEPLWAGAVVLGLYGVGFAIGAALDRAFVAAAATVAFLSLALVGVSVRGGWDAANDAASVWGRDFPRAAAWALDLSVLTLVFESSGRDFTHAHPTLYARSGVEWFPRRPYSGVLAGPTVLLLGSTFACLASRRQRRRAAGLATSSVAAPYEPDAKP